MEPTDTQDQAAAESDYPPSSVVGQDGKLHEIMPLELLLDAIDTAAEMVLARNAEATLYVLAELKFRLVIDAAMYERMFKAHFDGETSVRQ